MKIQQISKEKMEKREWLPEYDGLLNVACKMRERSYTPYSHYNVGAALVATDGTVFGGCNVENAAYGPTNCAERTALFKAVSEGYKKFDLIVVIGGPDTIKGGIAAPPCGICRQALREFVDPNKFYIVCPSADENYQVKNYKVFTLTELLPYSFGSENLIEN